MEHDPTHDELRSYLLGTLTEEDADRLEERLLGEGELFELSEAIEADLLAACDRGELAPEERERVLRRLASSPQGRERLALARSLNATAAAPAPAPVVVFPRRASSRQVFQWAALAAAGLLVTAGLSWYAMENPHGGEASSFVAQEHPAPANPVTTEASAPPQPPQIPQQKPLPAPLAKTPKPAKVVCQLALMTLRGAESTKRLTVPPGTEAVELQIGLEEGLDNLALFHIVVRSPQGETLLDKRGVKPKTLGGVRTLVVELPADRLAAGRYEIETQGTAPGSEPEALSPLSIKVVRGSKG
jgi:hypothetical protein